MAGKGQVAHNWHLNWKLLANAARLTPYRPAEYCRGSGKWFEVAFQEKSGGAHIEIRMWIGIISFLAVQIVYAADAPITSNPIPEPIVKRGIAVQVKDVARLPDTRGLRPANQDLCANRVGACELSCAICPTAAALRTTRAGFCIWMNSNNQPQVYADLTKVFPLTVHLRLQNGFIGFVFHPEFAKNGLFYTVHVEYGSGESENTDFIPIGYSLKDVTYHNVITGVARDEPGGQHVRGHAAASSFAWPTSLRTWTPSHGRGGESNPTTRNPATLITACFTPAAVILGCARRRRAEREQSRADATAQFNRYCHSAYRSAKPVGDGRAEGAGRLHHSDGEQVCRGRRPACAGRNLRLRVPQRPSAFVGHRRNHVRQRHRDEPHRKEINIVRNGENYGWMKPRRLLRPHGRPRGRRAESVVSASAGDFGRAREGRFYIPRGGLRSRRRAGGDRRLSPITGALRR